MKKWLLGLGVLIALLAALAFWLNSVALASRPQAEERRLEIDREF